MTKIFLIIFEVIILSLFNGIRGQSLEPLNNFTFGSYYYTQNQKRLDIFKVIESHKTELWIWLGDVLQITETSLFNLITNTPIVDKRANKIYQKLLESEYYGNFHNKTRIIGIWNNLDYGQLRGNKYFSEKDESKDKFLDFLGVPKEEQRKKLGRGLYSTYTFGSGFKTIRFIVLDVKYEKEGDIFNGRFSGDILGKDQWEWLEDTFNRTTETFTFIISSIQVLPFDRLYTDSWNPSSRKRLFNLIGKYRLNGVVLLSGDVGFAQFTRTKCIIPQIGYNLYEITSSGMSNDFNYNFGFLRKLFYEKILPHDYHISDIYNGYNFGEIKIDWGNSIEEAKLNVGIFDINDKKRLSLDINYNDIKRNYDLVFESEKKEPNCYQKNTKRFKFPHEYIYVYYKHPNELFWTIITGIIIYLIIYLICYIVKYYWIASLFGILSSILLFLYDDYNKRDFALFIE